MLSSLLAILGFILVHDAFASPIQRSPDIVQRANAAAGRYMALSDPISIHLIRARTTGPTGVTPTSSEPTAPASASKGKEDGKVPAVGVGAGNTSLLPLLSSTIPLAPPLTSQTGTSTLPNIPATSPTSSSGQTAAETISATKSSSTCTAQTSPIGSPAQVTAPTSTTSKQVGKVPAVGVGFDNTSLLTLLSSANDLSAQTSPFVPVNGMASAQTAAALEPAPSSSTTGPCTDMDPSTLSTGMAPVPASQMSASSATTGNTETPESSSESSSTIFAPIPVPESPPTSSVTDAILATASVPAGGTVTLRISTDATITVPFSEPVFPEPGTALALSVTSSAAISSDIEETSTVLVSTTMVPAIPSPSDFASVPASVSDVGLPGSPLGSTTVRPLSDPSGFVTQTITVIPPPTPVVSIQTPAVSSEATAPASAPTAGGNTVVPVMGSILTIMVTTTVTASPT